MSDQPPREADDLGLSDEDLAVVTGGVEAEALEAGKTTIIIIENP
jgi:hypothetical protein